MPLAASWLKTTLPLALGLAIGWLVYGLMPKTIPIPRPQVTLTLSASSPGTGVLYYDDGSGMSEAKTLNLNFPAGSQLQSHTLTIPAQRLKSIMFKPRITGQIIIQSVLFRQDSRRITISGPQLFDQFWFTNCTRLSTDKGLAIIDVTPESYFLLHADLTAGLKPGSAANPILWPAVLLAGLLTALGGRIIAARFGRLVPRLLRCLPALIVGASTGLLVYSLLPKTLPAPQPQVTITAGPSSPANCLVYYDDGTGMSENRKSILFWEDTANLQSTSLSFPVKQLKGILIKPGITGRVRIKQIHFKQGAQSVTFSANELFNLFWFTNCGHWGMENDLAVIDVNPESYFLMHRDLADWIKPAATPNPWPQPAALASGLLAALLYLAVSRWFRAFWRWLRDRLLPIGVGLAAALLCYLALWFAWPYQPTEITLWASLAKPAPLTLYYDDGWGMSELKQVSLPVKDTTGPQTIRWTHPRSKITAIMIMPRAKNDIQLHYIRWQHAGQTAVFTANNIFNFFWFTDVVRAVPENGTVAISTDKHSTFLMHKSIAPLIAFQKPHPWLLLLLAGLLGLAVGRYCRRLPGLIRMIFQPLRKPQVMFLTLAVPLGLAYLFLTPPFQAPDENNHFYRSYAISEGHLISRQQQNNQAGDVLPVSLPFLVQHSIQKINFRTSRKIDLAKLYSLKNLPLAPAVRKFKSMGSIVTYSPFNYLPQAAGIALARSLAVRPFFYIYWGRIFIFAVWLLLVYAAIRTAPVVKPLLLLVALLPTSLFIATTLSGDVLLNACALLFMALLLRCKLQPPSRSRLALLLAVAIMLTLSKLVYFPLLLLIFIIPAGHWPSRNRYWVFIAGFFLVCFACNAGWYALTRDLIPFAQMNPPELVLAKKHYVLHHPWAMLQLVWDNFSGHWLQYLRTGMLSLGSNDVPLHDNLLWLYLSALVVLAVRSHGSSLRITWQDKTIFLLVASGMVGIVLTTLFIVATPWQTSTLRVHGRYFLPLLLPLLLVFHNHLRPARRRFVTNIFIWLFLWLVHLYGLQHLVARFYPGF